VAAQAFGYQPQVPLVISQVEAERSTEPGKFAMV
jgi:hypothetical protein